MPSQASIPAAQRLIGLDSDSLARRIAELQGLQADLVAQIAKDNAPSAERVRERQTALYQRELESRTVALQRAQKTAVKLRDQHFRCRGLLARAMGAIGRDSLEGRLTEAARCAEQSLREARGARAALDRDEPIISDAALFEQFSVAARDELVARDDGGRRAQLTGLKEELDFALALHASRALGAATTIPRHTFPPLALDLSSPLARP